LSLSADIIFEAALRLVDQEGIEALTMRRLAARLGIRAPSIYKHLADKRALENALVSAGFEEMAGVFARAVASTTGDPLDERVSSSERSVP
jgi:AcrR family transcriptional regulator